METLMWAFDLILVAGLCIWAIREDKIDSIKDQRKRK